MGTGKLFIRQQIGILLLERVLGGGGGGRVVPLSPFPISTNGTYCTTKEMCSVHCTGISNNTEG